MKKFHLKFLPGIAWFFIVLFLMVIPGDDLPNEDWLDAIYFDKLFHLGSFALMSFLFIWPFLVGMTISNIRRTIWWIVASVCLWGLAIELIQLYLAKDRSFDLIDWVCDALGAIMGGYFSVWIFRRQRSGDRAQ